MFSKVARIGKVPSGATLVVDENERDAVLQQAGRLVLVITRKKDSCVRSEGALQRPITGTCVASMIVPTVPMRFAPSWARGEGAVTSLLRMLGMAATKALNGPVALVVLTERRGRIRVCRPREVRSGHGSRGYTRKNRMSNPESESLCSKFALGPQGKSPLSENANSPAKEEG